MTVYYEWCVEEIVDGYVEDLGFADSYKEVKEYASTIEQYEIALVRDSSDGRSWAYMKNGKLPEYFQDANGINTVKVPNKFHKEIEQ